MKKNLKTNELQQANNPCVSGGKRRVLKSVALAGAAAAVLPSQWKKPVLNSIVLPAHAQSSPICPELSVLNGTFGPGSAPGTCGLNFQFVSADASQGLDIISVVNTTPVGTDTVTYAGGTAGSVTATAGLTVAWVGQAVGAPFACASDAPVPVNEITFTVTYNCSIDSTVQTMDFSLQTIAAGL